MSRVSELVERVKALLAFLKIPLVVVLMFGVLAVVVYDVDSSLSDEMIGGNAALDFLENLFGDREATRSVLSTISSALITVTSITFSMLLVAVQQGASSFSSQILDQFLQRRQNQFYFGFFVGISLFSLVTLSTTHRIDHPLFGSLIAMVGTFVALSIILVLIYTTVEQMRSANVIAAISDMIEKARQCEPDLLECTAQDLPKGLQQRFEICSDEGGLASWRDMRRLVEALNAHKEPGLVVVIGVPAGTFVWRGDAVATVHSRDALNATVAKSVRAAIRESFVLKSAEDPAKEARAGIRQLSTIGWNSASSARSNPRPPILVCRSLVDFVLKWTTEPTDRRETSPVVYPDLVIADCIDALENIVVAAAEAKQPQTIAEVYMGYARLLRRVDDEYGKVVDTAVRRSLGTLTSHTPTRYLSLALAQLEDALEAIGSPTAVCLHEVREREQATGEYRDTSTGASP